jgi:hypothetical protein
MLDVAQPQVGHETDSEELTGFVMEPANEIKSLRIGASTRAVLFVSEANLDQRARSGGNGDRSGLRKSRTDASWRLVAARAVSHASFALHCEGASPQKSPHCDF